MSGKEHMCFVQVLSQKLLRERRYYTPDVPSRLNGFCEECHKIVRKSYLNKAIEEQYVLKT
jgi:hypothetical protein